MSTGKTKLPNFSIPKAHEAQKQLCKKIVQEDRLPEKIRLVAGIDVAYFDDQAVGAASVLDYETFKVVESQTAMVPVKFPYVPTLLSFREIPPSMAAIRRLKSEPDVFLVDAHGLAHPFGCGFASHLGLALGKPTIGAAKSRLVGEIKEIGGNKFLVHEGKTIAAVLTTRQCAKPVYVSIGNLVSLSTAVKIVKHCIRGKRIPEPLLEAHKIATETKDRIAGNIQYTSRKP